MIGHSLRSTGQGCLSTPFLSVLAVGNHIFKSEMKSVGKFYQISYSWQPAHVPFYCKKGMVQHFIQKSHSIFVQYNAKKSSTGWFRHSKAFFKASFLARNGAQGYDRIESDTYILQRK